MNTGSKRIALYLGTAVLTSCNAGFARLNKAHYYHVSSQNYEAFVRLRKQLNAGAGYRGYKHSQLHFNPSEIRGGYGLYYAEMPGKGTRFNVEIPCLISPNFYLINTSYFDGELKGDTLGLAMRIDSTLHDMEGAFSVTASAFTKTEFDSLRKVFLYGGFVEPKQGVSIDFR
ncbi:hypothetical protein [Hymenobacter properus]|uniref:Lipoprotein n=1 Tax=Hymenobacter properus TaxID=2791026 RepID=A0A931BLQ9_9BACT|nr:hypothetical protein [Hymenobacter properus]MBF9143692.1 hypothetical protein [Hymenobacter properus]MBR7722505.1 hypothetical protein [Microvirga sp. SRT04]